jgi:hypothetical protein
MAQTVSFPISENRAGLSSEVSFLRSVIEPIQCDMLPFAIMQGLIRLAFPR